MSHQKHAVRTNRKDRFFLARLQKIMSKKPTKNAAKTCCKNLAFGRKITLLQLKCLQSEMLKKKSQLKGLLKHTGPRSVGL
jgi:hypothetical protein